YKQVLKIELGKLEGIKRAREPQRLPTVLTKEEVKRILQALTGTTRLMVALLYGTGMRAMELLRLRVKDVDFDRQLITIREAKGNKDRITMLPANLKEPLMDHLVRVKYLHESDIKIGLGRVFLPRALKEKYPHMDRSWAWQYVFPAKSM